MMWVKNLIEGLEGFLLSFEWVADTERGRLLQ